MKARKMYIDVDGVLVVWDAEHNCVELARGLGRLMRFCKLHDIKPYWLSMWTLFPGSIEGLNGLLWPRTCPTMATPEPLVYDRAKGKSSVVDFESDFVWIEDGLGPGDLALLERHQARDRFFWTDGLDPDCLLKFMAFARARLGLPETTEWGPAWESSFTRPRRPLDAAGGGASSHEKP